MIDGATGECHFVKFQQQKCNAVMGSCVDVSDCSRRIKDDDESLHDYDDTE